MSKKKQMKHKKKHSFGWFILGMVVYAVLFLGATYFGLDYLWDYMEAYEASRPNNTVNAYMDELTLEHIVDMSVDEVYSKIDSYIQSEEECREYMLNALSEGVTHAKKTRECTDTRQVYVLRTGSTVLGEFSITANAPDEYGFTTWDVEGESFDMTYLVGTQTVSMTVPEGCAVWVNGRQLGSEYIIEEGIRYEEILEYYEEYDLPCRVTYEAGPFLGEMEISATDENGDPVTFDENTDYSVYYLNCTEEETSALNEFTAEFVKRYVAFTGSNDDNRNARYHNLIEYVVEGSEMASRLRNALDGLQYGQSRRDDIVSLVTHLQLRLEEGKYLCDITYEVDTTGKKGVVRTTTNAKLYIVTTDDGMRLESIEIY